LPLLLSTPPPPPSSPLFPYTPLFRSLPHRYEQCAMVARFGRFRDGPTVLLSVVRFGQPEVFRTGCHDTPPRSLTKETRGIEQATDRKSTRLNSSHVKISYAVFCLKKK